jgi:hypothetical protein
MNKYDYPYLELLELINEYVGVSTDKIETELKPRIKCFEESVCYSFNVLEKEEFSINVEIIGEVPNIMINCKASNFFTASLLFGEYIPKFMVEGLVEGNVLTNPKTGNQIIFQDGNYVFNQKNISKL